MTVFDRCCYLTTVASPAFINIVQNRDHSNGLFFRMYATGQVWQSLTRPRAPVKNRKIVFPETKKYDENVGFRKSFFF